jgi:hypothetical protein
MSKTRISQITNLLQINNNVWNSFGPFSLESENCLRRSNEYFAGAVSNVIFESELFGYNTRTVFRGCCAFGIWPRLFAQTLVAR